MSLKNKVVVILGGSSGIGLATAQAAIDEGAKVVITGRRREQLDRAVAHLGGAARGVALDSSDEVGMKKLFGELDAVDHIFSVAGSAVLDSRLEVETSVMRPAMDVRFWGAVYAGKYGAPKMRDGSSIVLMSGTSSQRPISGAAVGSSSCAAVEALARALAVDLAPIRVNAIRPGLIDTPLIDSFTGTNKESFLKTFLDRIPAKRVGTPEEVADAVLFLMKNTYVNGITLPIDGGAILM